MHGNQNRKGHKIYYKFERYGCKKNAYNLQFEKEQTTEHNQKYTVNSLLSMIPIKTIITRLVSWITFQLQDSKG